MLFRFAVIMLVGLLLLGKPGRAENATGVTFSLVVPDTLTTEATYTALFSIINQDHVRGVTDHINLTIKYDLHNASEVVLVDFAAIINLNSKRKAKTGSLTPTIPGNFTFCAEMINATTIFNTTMLCKNITVQDAERLDCNITLDAIEVDNFIIPAGEKTKYAFILNNESIPFIIEYSIKDLFGASVRKKRNTSNTNAKSFTPKSIKERDKVFVINATVYPQCNDTKTDDNQAQQFLIVTSNEEQEKSSWIQMESKDAKFGSAALVNLKVYKGDTRKYAISIYVTDKNNKKVSAVSKVYVKGKYLTYDFLIPVQLKDICKQGTFYIVAEGLGLKERQRITIEKNDCKPLQKPILPNVTYEYQYILNYSNHIENIITIKNPTNKKLTLDVTSMITKGRKQVSESKKKVQVPKKSNLTFSIRNTMHNLTSGTYRVTIHLGNQKLKKDINLTTEKKITKKIAMNAKPVLSNITKNATKVRTEVIYQSPSSLSKRFAPYLIAGVSLLLASIIFWKKKDI